MQLPKFEDCRLCRNSSTSDCETCDSGENFEPRGVRPLSFDDERGVLIQDDDEFSSSLFDLGFDDDQ